MQLQDNQEILGHSPDDFAPEFQPDGVRSSERGDEILAAVMKDGMVRYEWAHLKHDPARTLILTDVICTLIQIAGQPMIHTSIRDITDRKNAEDALRDREATLSSIFRAAPIGIGLVSNRVIIRVNDRLCEMTGYSAGELIGKSARILYPDDEEFERVGREKYELIRKFGTGTIETRWRRKDGDIRDVLLSSTPLDPENLAIGVTFTALDITDRKRAESELRDAYEQIAATEEELRGQYEELAHSEQRIRESEAKFRAIIDQSFQFIGLMTTDGILIEANQAALKFAGISESAVINRPFWETPWWSHSADLQEVLKDAIQRAASGETVRFEATHRAANGHLAYIDFSIKPMVDPTGRILYLIPEGRDLTERKQAEEKLLLRMGSFRQPKKSSGSSTRNLRRMKKSSA